MKDFINGVALAVLILVCTGMQAQKRDKLGANQIPVKVMECLKAKFPKAEIETWAREREGDFVVYDIEFKQAGQKFEADIKEDGTIHNWEKAIAAKNLPPTVRKAVEKKYPGARIKEIMEITAMKDGKDELEGYEVVLRTSDKKNVEVTVAPDGKILEDSGDKK